MKELLWVALAVVAVILVAAVRFIVRGGRRLGSPTQRATYETLRTANLAVPALRSGLNAESAAKTTAYVRSLLGTRGVFLADLEGVLARLDVDDEHVKLLAGALEVTLATGRPQVLTGDELACSDGAFCTFQVGIVVPLTVDGSVVGAIGALDGSTHAGSLRLAAEVAQFVSTQLELAQLEWSRRRAVQAELRFLRAQISPHFVYNSLTAIESFIRSDPDRARELLVAFADFTRYSFRDHDQFVTIAEELRLVDICLDLERARFGDRLNVTLRVAPEVLSVLLPSLTLQPLVENAIRHGLESSEAPGRLQINIEDLESEARISVEDNGVGAEPTRLRRILAGSANDDAVGLRNVDERLRTVYGQDHGLTIETAPGAGTKVMFRVPKYQSRLQAS